MIHTGVTNVLKTQLADFTTSWSVGTFGAVAEFSRGPKEELTSVAPLVVITARGGIRIDERSDMTIVASESINKTDWSQRVSLCLPEAASAMSRRSVLSELGPDREALRDPDRDCALFDLGLDCLQVDVCVRIADGELVSELRKYCGRSLFDPGNPAMNAILAASPPRVFIGRIGRIEVFQTIPPSDGKSPEGPHTHVLPKLIASKRSHAATEYVPPGLIPCAHFYPQHPLKDEMGCPTPFNAAKHADFQALMKTYGSQKSMTLKRKVIDAVEADDDPSIFAIPDDRQARANVRIALRQFAASDPTVKDLREWFNFHDEGFNDPSVENDGTQH
jgi:hypothetical protein